MLITVANSLAAIATIMSLAWCKLPQIVCSHYTQETLKLPQT